MRVVAIFTFDVAICPRETSDIRLTQAVNAAAQADIMLEETGSSIDIAGKGGLDIRARSIAGMARKANQLFEHGGARKDALPDMAAVATGATIGCERAIRVDVARRGGSQHKAGDVASGCGDGW